MDKSAVLFELGGYTKPKRNTLRDRYPAMSQETWVALMRLRRTLNKQQRESGSHRNPVQQGKAS